MKRREARENAFINFFEFSFDTPIDELIAFSKTEDCEYSIDAFGEDLLKMYDTHSQEIDNLIESKLKGWKVSRLSRVNLAVLRLAVTEIKYGEADMESVVINEAVELAKTYGSEEDYQFVNGVLGTLVREDITEIKEKENTTA